MAPCFQLPKLHGCPEGGAGLQSLRSHPGQSRELPGRTNEATKVPGRGISQGSGVVVTQGHFGITCGQIPAVSPGQVLNLQASVSLPTMGLPWGLNVVMFVKCLAQSLIDNTVGTQYMLVSI